MEVEIINSAIPEPVYKVYVKVDKYGVVVAVDNDKYMRNIADNPDWIYIDEGKGEKYRRAQVEYFTTYENVAGNYIATEERRWFTSEQIAAAGLEDFEQIGERICKWRVSNGKLVERSIEEYKLEVERIKCYNVISNKKQYLNNTDYISCKISDGAATKEEYADELAKRAAARAEINAMDARIAEIDEELMTYNV